MINLVKKLSLATLLALGTVSSAQAMVLDTFDYNTSVTGSTASGQTTSIGPITGVTATVPAGDVTYELTTTSASIIGPVAGSSAASGVLYLFNNNGTSNLTLSYNDLVGAPATGLDITDYGLSSLFYFDIEFIDLGFSLELTVEDIGSNTATANYTQQTAILPSDPTERIFVSFSDFVGSADFDHVKSITAVLTAANAGADLTISEVGTTGIPEPTTIAIFGLALVGFAFSSKRKA
jgi:hypothetical protein